MSKSSVLLIGSNARQIEFVVGVTRPTGYDLNELVVLALAGVNAGYEAVVTTPSGARSALEEVSGTAAHYGNSEQRLQAAVDFIESNPVMQSPAYAETRARYFLAYDKDSL